MSRATGAVIDVSRCATTSSGCVNSHPVPASWPLVKANAYGHGLALAAQAAAGADAFAVAGLEEAQIVRRAGLSNPIVLLEGVFGEAELEAAARWGRNRLVVHDAYQLQPIENSGLKEELGVWLKVDTGDEPAGVRPRGGAGRLEAPQPGQGSSNT